jgi:hypothetical protein
MLAGDLAEPTTRLTLWEENLLSPKGKAMMTQNPSAPG